MLVNLRTGRISDTMTWLELGIQAKTEQINKTKNSQFPILSHHFPPSIEICTSRNDNKHDLPSEKCYPTLEKLEALAISFLHSWLALSPPSLTSFHHFIVLQCWASSSTSLVYPHRDREQEISLLFLFSMLAAVFYGNFRQETTSLLLRMDGRWGR